MSVTSVYIYMSNISIVFYQSNFIQRLLKYKYNVCLLRFILTAMYSMIQSNTRAPSCKIIRIVNKNGKLGSKYLIVN